MRASQTTLVGVQDVLNSVTALAGGGKTGATPLTAAINRISVCATAADSVLLPPALKGIDVFVQNDGVASAQVFGQGTDTINAVATATGVAQAAAKAALYVCYADGAWVRLLSA